MKEQFDYKGYVRESYPYLDKLNLNDHEIGWLADVKKTSEDYQEKAEKTKEAAEFTAFDIAEFHLIMLELQQLRNEPMNRRAEYLEKDLDRKAEKIIAYIYKDIQRREKSGISRYEEGFGDGDVLGQIRLCATGHSTTQRKLEVITHFLSLMHAGGSNLGLTLFPGIPQEKHYDKIAGNEKQFLSNLEHLGNAAYWEQVN